jgi:hypothetical protein
MLKLISAAVVALAVALPATVSLADDADQDNNTVTVDSQKADSVFDLGIDVTGVAHTSAAVRGYLGALAPVTRDSIVKACETYMAHPESAQAQDTLAFCSAAVGG